MAAPSLIPVVGCAYYSPSPSFSRHNSSRNGGAPSSSPPLDSSSCSCSSSPGLSFSSSGVSSNWKYQGIRAHAMDMATQGNFDSSSLLTNGKNEPDHLLVLVHGILASPGDWNYVQAELKKRLGKNYLLYASSSNTYTKTFGGIDGAGKRLAEEVTQVVSKTQSLKRISFLAHSLGGLFARYAIAVLYSEESPSNDIETGSSRSGGRIAGLDPVNFITLATPHLGVRGRNQLPLLLGIPFLEKLVPPIAHIFVGYTGKQLFLTDGQPNKPPLLLRMTSDCEEGKFISALGSFRCRTVYANVSYDLSLTMKPDMVGWRTSSIRRETELVNPPRRSLDGYKHVVDVEYCPPVSTDGPHFPPEAAKAKAAAQNEPSTKNTVEYHDIMEEEMIHGLQQLGWKKIDVSFHSAFWPFFAHNNIHVKNEWFHNAGAGVIAHVADSLKQQEPSSYLTASL
ncbi:Lipid droplet phospholipase 1 [Linum grandiflorum]